jgi:3',5'-cyclic AMP phosphodiesterase CpdA
LKGKLPRLPVLVLLLIFLSVVAPSYVPTKSSNSVQIFNDPVSYPLPTVPEPILANGTIMVEVIAGASAEGWTAKVVSDRASSVLVFVNSSQVDDGKWVLYFDVDGTLVPGLYSLNLAYTNGGEAVNHTQSRCIWALEDWPDKLTIGHVTDTHLPYGADEFASFVYEINLIQPDLVIHTGDVVDNEMLANSWSYFQEIFSRMTIPSFFHPGNHDHKGANGALYQKYCGLLNYSVVIGDFLFIALDSGDPGFVPIDQLEWAESVLQRNPDKVKIIGVHHPLFSNPPGEYINGSWEDIESLMPYMYFTWLDNLNESRVFLRLVEEYDVRLILAGHVHENVYYVYNGNHYFVTTGPCGGGLREGGFPGYRLIEIDNEGNLAFDAYTMANLFDTMNYIPLGNIVYYYSAANDGTKPAVSAVVINRQEQSLTAARLEFVVSSEYDIEDYQFYPNPPDNYETFTNEEGHHFIVYVDVPSQSSLFLTLAAVEDTVDPAINVEVQGEIEEEKPVLFLIEASDTGWGVKNVEAAYTVGDEETIHTISDMNFTLRVSEDEYVLDYPTVEYIANVTGQTGGTLLHLTVQAWDFAGNSETYQADFTIGAPPPLPTHVLSIESSPVTGVSFTLGGQSQTTPYSVTLEEGDYTVTAQEEITASGKTYNFEQWSDGNTDTLRTLTLVANTTLTMEYKEAPVVETGIPIWQIGVVAAVVAVVVVVAVLKMKKQI